MIQTRIAVPALLFSWMSLSGLAADWTIETIEPTKQFARDRTAIAIDASGRTHLAYGGDHLYYAQGSGAVWEYATVDSSTSVGADVSLALDAEGKAHLSYRDSQENDLKYATNASGDWEITTVDQAGTVGEYAAIALDSEGHAHLSYFFRDLPTLRYATNASGSWTTTDVHVSSGGPFGSGFVGWYTDIALDSNDQVHISYLAQQKGKLRYATNASGPWLSALVADIWPESPFFAGSPVQTSIAIDSGDVVHIVHGYNPTVPSTSVHLKHASNSTGVWVSEFVDESLADVGKYNDLAIDSNDVLHVSYASGDNSNRDLRWNLRYASNGSGSWESLTVDDGSQGGLWTDTRVGVHTSIAVDQENRPRISYLNTTAYLFNTCTDEDTGNPACQELDLRDSLVVASSTVAGWTIEIADRTGDVGDRSSIAVDPEGGVHVTYHESLVDTLKYAHKESGDWVAVTIGDTGYSDSPGGDRSSAVAVDSSGTVHVLYSNLDENNPNTEADGSVLIYLTRAPGGVWSPSTLLGEQTTAGFSPSLAIDRDDVLHSCFYLGGAIPGIRYARHELDWTTEEVLRGSTSADIAVDSGNAPHVVTLESGAGLTYLTRVAGAWTEPVTIDAGANVNQRAHIEVDSAGVPHVVYTGPDGLTHAQGEGAGWTRETIGPTGGSDLAIDAGDHLHVCLGRGGELFYLENSSGSWSTPELVDGTASVGSPSSIAVGVNGRVHISYYDGTHHELKYATTVIGAADLVASPEIVEFGTVDVGEVTTRSVALSNRGDATLELSDIRLEGSGGINGFSVNLSGGASPCAGSVRSLEPGESCTIGVGFMPRAVGSVTGRVLIESNDADGPLLAISLRGTGTTSIPIPAIRASPRSHDFGSVSEDSASPPLEVTLSNAGAEDIEIVALDPDLTFSFHFSLRADGGATPCGTAPLTLGPGDSCTFEVVFQPRAVANFLATLTVRSNDPLEPELDLSFEGTGTPRLEVPGIAVSPRSLDFGEVTEGTVSEPIEVTISNVGGEGLQISEIVGTPPPGLANQYSVDFEAGDVPCGEPPFLLAPDASCTFEVTFHPRAAGLFLANLVIHSDDAIAPELSITVRGEGTPRLELPGIAVSPPSLDFGEVTEGTLSEPIEVTIQNVSDESLQISEIRGTPSPHPVNNYSVDFEAGDSPCGEPPFLLAPDASCTFEVTFHPLGALLFQAILVIHSDDPVAPELTITVRGEGTPRLEVPAISVTPPILDFGQVSEGHTSPPLEATISNLGGVDLEITGYEISGQEDPPVYQVSPSGGSTPCGEPPFTLAPGASCTITAVFRPPVQGVIERTLTISSDDVVEPELIVPLRGTGVPELVIPGLLVSPPQLDFGTVSRGGEGPPIDLRLANISADSLEIQAFGGAAQADPPTFSVNPSGGSAPCGDPPFTLLPGEDCTLLATFTPHQSGNHLWSFTIDSDDPVAPVIEIPFRGMAVDFAPAQNLSVSPGSFDFGEAVANFPVPEISSLVVNLSNTGGAPLALRNAGISDAFNYRLVFDEGEDSCGTLPSALLPGTSCSLRVDFVPKELGVLPATLAIGSDDPDTPILTVPLSGTGVTPSLAVPDILVYPRRLDFGHDLANDPSMGPSSIRPVTLGNLGETLLTVGDLVLSDTEHFEFYEDVGLDLCGSMPQTLAQLEICRVRVLFNPRSVGEFEATLTVRSDDPESPAIAVALRGIGASDLDGLTDEEEQGPDGSDPLYDGNSDGIPDHRQDNAGSLSTHSARHYVTISTPVGHSLRDLRAVDNPAPADAPEGVDYPYDFLVFTIRGLEAGGPTTATLTLPEGETADGYYKYGPTPTDPYPHWYEFLYDGTTGAEILGNVIVLHFVDGERGDDDLTANGRVRDDGGPYRLLGGDRSFVRGDADASGTINLTDGIFVLNYLFLGGQTPGCLEAADSDDSGVVNITDGIYILGFLFLGGPAPPAPHPSCGPGSAGEPDCVEFEACP